MNIIIIGYGKMGKMVEQIAIQQGDSIVCKIDSEKDWNELDNANPKIIKQSVAIDFSTPATAICNIRECFKRNIPIVVGTTGWADIKDEVVAYFEKCGTPMIWASNFSIGVNVFFAVTDYVTRLLGETGGYSPYMVEMHHCHKLDAPSGTARSLADIVDANMDVKTDIQSVRCGEISGIHTVGYEGLNDRITMTHEAFSREGSAVGAVEAALRTEGLNGVHEFKELFFE